MAVKVILALSLSLFFISQVSSDLKTNQETSHVSQVFNRGGEAPGGRKLLMNNIVLHFSKYFLNRPTSHALAPTPAPALGYHLDCGGLCKNRCSLHSRQNVCIRACGTCCIRCKCVPPGTFGNREMCGKCYTDMTTHGNKTKCP